MATTVEKRPQKTPIYRNVTFLKWAAQLLALAIALAVIWVLGRTVAQNIQDRGITFGWGWLEDPPGITIREGIDTNPATGARALLVGIVNMLRVTATGIIAATILGTIIGVARLSRNWIVNKMATVYIETIRNIPLLVQIFFWLAAIQVLGEITEDDVGEKWFFPSAKGVGIPWISPSDGFWQWLIFVGIGVGASIWVYKWRMRLKDERGGETHAIAWGTATVVVFAVVGWFAHPLFGSLEFVWSGLASFFSGFPVFLMQIILAVGAVAIAAWWIKSFLDALRTGSGLAKLTDDDWFRVIFAGVMGVLAAGLFLLFSPIAELLLDGFVLLFEWLETRFALDNTSQPMAFSRPEVIPTGNFFNFGTSGIVITPGFFAVWVGVTIYTAAFIAEIVRGGILAVPKGQTEAAGALGLRRSQMLRLVILPQAFRIILPPLGNQYLNLAKNTSLGIAVAYPEIVQVGQTLYNQTGQSLPVVLVWMAFFLTVSLTISAVVNYFNRRMQLVER